MKIERGITLIALIITIILMLILAGVVLSLTIGENGIFKTAKYVTKKWNNSVEQENRELDKLYAYINGESLPENTKDTDAGTLVAVPDGWKTNTPAYVQTPDGKEVVSSKKISTVQAVATGDGETVPVPLGFYYVGGKVSTGVVISDNKADQNKYKNEIEIPSGIEAVLNEDGSVKEIKRTLIGNQFIWVPCTEEEYVKINWGNDYSDSVWDTTTAKAETIQIRKYKGFYVGRYEAGLDSNILEFTTTQANASSIYNQEGKPQSKPGVIPWNFISWTQSKENAENMYKTNYVDSGLITGTQWDVMINWMTNENESELVDSGTFGNYANVTLKINLGRMAYGYITTAWYQDAFENEWVNNGPKPMGDVNTNRNGKGHLWTTGASDEARKKNLYDVAGNLNEWVEETSFYGGSDSKQYRVFRGGGFLDSKTGRPICYRGCGSDDSKATDQEIGFRVVLYMR
ncbi:MAG: SUMF1/EgtB/PvdO family nonheme iron enzyme [Clostridia bacterium]|nr:SUMF1/EgtB/PvdO family nonheme iron enzyme [Clostridia bacterium]